MSVVMISYLDDYERARLNPGFKFKRAVDSFLEQNWENKELVIIADGCDITKHLYQKYYSHQKNIKFFWTNKSKARWPGELRQHGCNLATGDWICYLDSDDILAQGHLTKLASKIEDGVEVLIDNYYLQPYIDESQSDPEKIYLTSYIHYPKEIMNKWSKSGRIVLWTWPTLRLNTDKIKCLMLKLDENMLGTWRISHSKEVTHNVQWKNSNNENGGEDRQFVSNVIEKYKPKYLDMVGTYVICHSRSENSDGTLHDY
jgi:glycosyltransferase involved in cell wall biosynthesis